MATRKSTTVAPKTSAPKTGRRTQKKMTGHSRSDYKVRFFVSDDIRTDNDGKPMLIGFYPDNIVGLKVPADVTPTSSKPLGIAGLTFMFTISAPPGEHEATLSIEFSDEKVSARKIENRFQTTSKKSSYNIIAKSQPFPVFAFGTQNLKLVVDGHEFNETFELRRFDIS